MTYVSGWIATVNDNCVVIRPKGEAFLFRKVGFVMTVSLATYVKQNLTATESEKEKVKSVLYRMFSMGVISEEELLRSIVMLRNE